MMDEAIANAGAYLDSINQAVATALSVLKTRECSNKHQELASEILELGLERLREFVARCGRGRGSENG